MLLFCLALRPTTTRSWASWASTMFPTLSKLFLDLVASYTYLAQHLFGWKKNREQASSRETAYKIRPFQGDLRCIGNKCNARIDASPVDFSYLKHKIYALVSDQKMATLEASRVDFAYKWKTYAQLSYESIRSPTCIWYLTGRRDDDERGRCRWNQISFRSHDS